MPAHAVLQAYAHAMTVAPKVARTISSILLACAATAPALAQGQLIDDFSTGGALLRWDAPIDAAGFARNSTQAGVPGNVRDMAFHPLPGSTDHWYMSSSGTFQVNRFVGQSLYASLAYGQVLDMNLDLSGQAALRLDMIFAGGAINAIELPTSNLGVTVYAYTSNGAGLNADGSAAFMELPKLDAVEIPFSSFSTNAATGQPVDWADVDSLLIVFSELAPTQATYMGLELRSISAEPVPQAVPEPAPALLAGLGLALVGLQRRLRRRRA